MAGQHPSGLSWGDVGEKHLSHSAVVYCSQALWATGVYHQQRNAVEVLEEEESLPCSQAVWGKAGYHQLRIALEELEEEGSLQYQLDCGKGMLYPHCLRECLEG